jgi:hypothetical protein
MKRSNVRVVEPGDPVRILREECSRIWLRFVAATVMVAGGIYAAMTC